MNRFLVFFFVALLATCLTSESVAGVKTSAPLLLSQQIRSQGARGEITSRTWSNSSPAAQKNQERKSLSKNGDGSATLLWSIVRDAGISNNAAIMPLVSSVVLSHWKQTDQVSIKNNTDTLFHIESEATFMSSVAARKGRTAAALAQDLSTRIATLTVWDASKPSSAASRWTYTIRDAEAIGHNLAMSEDGSRIAVFLRQYGAEGMRSLLLVFDAASNKTIAQWQDGTNPLNVKMSQDGKKIALRYDTSVGVFCVQEGKLIWTKELGFATDPLAISPDGTYVLWGFGYV